jgi:predicted site-specific integrase-resolvase
MEEKWHTYKEILELLGVHKQTLNNWRRNGNIIYKRLSSKTFLYKLPETENIQEHEKEL